MFNLYFNFWFLKYFCISLRLIDLKLESKILKVENNKVLFC